MNHHGDRVPGRGRGCFGLPVGAAGHPLLPRLAPVDVAVDQHMLASKKLQTRKTFSGFSRAAEIPHLLFHGAVPDAEVWKVNRVTGRLFFRAGCRKQCVLLIKNQRQTHCRRG